MTTDINGIPALVKEIRGDTVKVLFEKPVSVAAKTDVKLKIPKKTIAIVDFEVIKGAQKEAGRVTLEGLTSALIDTNQFVVVERSKLKSVMNELQLSLSGMTREKPDKVIGSLLIADLVLTGTLAETQGEWDINLRVINVRTGQAHAAIAMKTRLFRATEIRDSGPWQENFDSATPDPAWQIMYRQAGKSSSSYWRVGIDRNAGALNSKRSLKIEFDFRGDRRMQAKAENRRKRDLSLYNGIEFYARASEKIVGQVHILCSMPDDINRIDNWTAYFEADTNWEKIRIPFDQLVVARGWIRGGSEKYGARPGDQVLRLFRVESFVLSVDSNKNPETKASVWIDGINFYRD
jgi:TolB-like protein